MIVGLGLDLVEIERVRRMLARHGDHMLRRLFTEVERDHAARRVDPAPHLAARLAAKEAAFKALSGDDLARAIGWRDLEVVSAPDGRPTLWLHGSARVRAERLGVTRALVTLSHSKGMAAAVVVLEAAGAEPALPLAASPYQLDSGA